MLSMFFSNCQSKFVYPNNNFKLEKGIENITKFDIEIINKINKDYNLKQSLSKYFKNLTIYKLYYTDRAIIYIDSEKKYCIKIFHNKYNKAKSLCDVEEKTYNLLTNIPNTPLIYDRFSGSYHIIVMNYLGIDGLNYFNQHKIPMYSNWKTLVCDTILTLDIIHKKNIYHGDIKLDNLVYNEANNNWNFIDFGFSILPKNKSICGTFPYILPYRNNNIDKNKYRKIQDIFALSITILTMINIPHDEICDFCRYENFPCKIIHKGKNYGTRLNIYKYTEIRNNIEILNNWYKLSDKYRPILELLLDMILSQLDIRYKYIIWQNKKFQYYGLNEINFNFNHKTNIENLWEKIITLVNLW